MVLGFKPQFVEKILNGTKIHTIRGDWKHRWQEGKKIHFATGVRTKNYKCFKEGVCTGNRRIEINPEDRVVSITVNGCETLKFNKVGLDALAKNDGFDSVEDFWLWFDKPFVGKIIYWTGFKY